MAADCAKYFIFLLCTYIAIFVTSVDASKLTENENSTSLTNADIDGNCWGKEQWKCYLEAAVHMIEQAKIHFPTCPTCNISQPRAQDCIDVLRNGHNSSGLYTIWPLRNVKMPLIVYCDMETDGGGWIVIQRRGQFQNPIDYFYRDWKDYKEGFGDLKKEFWLGNDIIFELTNDRQYMVRFDVVDHYNESRYAEYRSFRLDDEAHKYKIHISDFSGNAGDSMIALGHNGNFSTRDQDNDPDANYHCTDYYKGPWWYHSCWYGNLNGENRRDIQGRGIIWKSWKEESLASSEIKIRPRYCKS